MARTPWGHVPNAALIDNVMLSLEHDPQKWIDAWNTSVSSKSDRMAWKNAVDEAVNIARSPTWRLFCEVLAVTAPGEEFSKARSCARGTVAALMAWSSSKMDSLHVDEIVSMARAGDKEAMLLLPAIHALEMSVS